MIKALPHVAHGFVVPPFAKRTGFSGDDLSLLFEALGNLFTWDRSASRGEMTVRGLYVFEHATAIGSAQAAALFSRIEIARRNPDVVARAFADYEVKIDENAMPDGVRLIKLVV